MIKSYIRFVVTLWLACDICLGENTERPASPTLDAPGRITTPLMYSTFLGSGRIVSSAPPTLVHGQSHEVWFEVTDAIVHKGSGPVVRFHVPTSVYDPALFPPRPPDDAPEDTLRAWWEILKLSTQKVYHVGIWKVWAPEPYLFLNLLYSDEEWAKFSEDCRAALAGRYVWTDPAVLKYREYLNASVERRAAYEAMTNNLISREDYEEKKAKEARLRAEYEALADPNNPDHLLSGAGGDSEN